MKFTLINTGKATKLASLIKSGDIKDHHVINIYDTTGQFITKGNWFQDNILNWGSFTGIATKAGTGNTVSFKLI